MSGDHNQHQKDKSYLDGMDRYKQVRELVKDPSLRIKDIVELTGYDKGHVSRLRKASQQFECPRCGHCCNSDLARVGEVGVWGGVQCEPQEEVEDGWCDWVCPKPRGYLMQCCDCELIHEVDFRVVRYESEDSEVYEVVDDPNLQAQMRLRRRDDLSPTILRQALETEQEPVAWRYKYPDGFWRFSNGERVNGSDSIKSQALYTAPPKKEWVGLTDEEVYQCEQLAAIRYQRHKYSVRGQIITPADGLEWHFAQAIEAKLKEKNT